MPLSNVIATVKSNEEQRTIVKDEQVKVLGQGQQGTYWIFTFPELKVVEQLLHIEFETDPEMWIIRAGLPQDKTYGDGVNLAENAVGVSLYLAIGTTVTDEVNGTTLTGLAVAIGF